MHRSLVSLSLISILAIAAQGCATLATFSAGSSSIEAGPGSFSSDETDTPAAEPTSASSPQTPTHTDSMVAQDAPESQKYEEQQVKAPEPEKPEPTEEERRTSIGAPYVAAGHTGDRLALMIDHINYAMYGVGGGELRTPEQLKQAKVIFELLGPNTATGLYTLRRFEFKGDKLVSRDQEDFERRPSSRYFR